MPGILKGREEGRKGKKERGGKDRNKEEVRGKGMKEDGIDKRGDKRKDKGR